MPESRTDPVELVRQGYPRLLHAAKRLMDGDEQPVLVAQVDGVHQLAVDVELQLGRSPVADPHRRRAQLALQVRELLLR